MTAATPDPALELKAGALRLALRPDLGGAHRRLLARHDRRSCAAASPATLSVARARRAATRWCPTRTARLPALPLARARLHARQPNFDDNPHSLHGTAWQQPWRVTSADATHAELALTHLADAHWPFAFDLTQRFELSDRRR